jgi:hypothetical protein
MGQNYGPSPGSGQYYPVAIGGDLFSGGNQAVVATALAAGLPTTYTGGLVLANPIDGTKNLVIQRAQAAFIVAQTNAAVIGLGVGYSTSALAGTLTAVASVPAVAGSSAAATGKLYSSASITLPAAPYLARILGSVDTGALTVAVDAASLALDVQGSIVLPPGAFAVFLSSAAGTASSFFGSFVWLELPAGATE